MGKTMTKAELKKLMNRKISARANTIAKALECYRLASEEKKHECPNQKCPYRNPSDEFGHWCCANSIMFDAVRKLRQQDQQIKNMRKKFDKRWTC